MRKMMIAAAVAAAATFQVTVAKAQDVVIGFGGIFSGPYSTYSQDARNGINVMVDKINADGGVLGRKLRVEFYDTAADRAKAIAIYRKWATDPNIVGYLTISTIEFIALDPIAAEVKLPVLPFGSSTPFPKLSPWSFRTNTVLTKTAPFVLEELKRLKGVKSIAIMQDNANPAMVAEATAFKDAAAKVGIEVKKLETFNTNDQDFSTQLTNIRAADPDLINLAGSTYEASLIISQAKALKIRANMFGGSGLNDPRIANLPNNAANGTITFFPFDTTSDRPLVKNFVAEYNKRNNAMPSAYSALGADAILTLAEGVRKAGSTDREKIREALSQIKELEVLNGKVGFGPEGGDNLFQTTNLFENVNGKYNRLQ